MQLVITDPELQSILDEEEKDVEHLNPDDQLRLAMAVIRNKDASETLKAKMQLLINQRSIE
jgi:hypothetical protein